MYIENANSTKTILPAGILLEKSEEPVALDTKTYYQQIIRTLIYAAIGTRPDIAFVAMRLLQFNNNPMQDQVCKICTSIPQRHTGTQNQVQWRFRCY